MDLGLKTTCKADFPRSGPLRDGSHGATPQLTHATLTHPVQQDPAHPSTPGGLDPRQKVTAAGRHSPSTSRRPDPRQKIHSPTYSQTSSTVQVLWKLQEQDTKSPLPLTELTLSRQEDHQVPKGKTEPQPREGQSEEQAAAVPSQQDSQGRPLR